MVERFPLNVNDQQHEVEAGPDMPLLYALRNDLGLNNPKFGCGLGQCGACLDPASRQCPPLATARS
jgi:nicotinate dehydrogenase subunit A